MSELTEVRKSALTQWLFENGGPTIRYSVAKEFDNLPEKDTFLTYNIGKPKPIGVAEGGIRIRYIFTSE